MAHKKTLSCGLKAGRWVLIAHTAVACEILLCSLFLLANHLVTGQSTLRLSPEADAIVFALTVVPVIAMIFVNGLFILFICRVLRGIHHAGQARQAITLFAFFVPFWGLRYYSKFRARTLQAVSEEAA